jgi:predicted lactoylglutathione lyase
MLRLSELQRKIDEATEEMHNIEAHKNMYNYRYQDHDGRNHDNLHHEEFDVQDFLYDEAFALTLEL